MSRGCCVGRGLREFINEQLVRILDAQFLTSQAFFIYTYTSSPCQQEAIFIWPAPFCQCNRSILRQKAVGTCLYMPQNGHWLASFEVILSPKTQIVSFSWPKNENSGRKLLLLLCSKTSGQRKILVFFGRLFGNYVTPISILANNKRSCSLNGGKVWTKIAYFFFPAKILSRRSRLSRTTSTLIHPGRLIRPSRPINCDWESEHQSVPGLHNT